MLGAADKNILDPLRVLQKKAIRIITEYPIWSTQNQYLLVWKFLYFSKYVPNCNLFIYKCLYIDKFTCLTNRRKINSEYHNYSTRNNSYYRLPGSRLKQVVQSFLYKGLKIWNDDIDQNLSTYISIRSFKTNQSTFKITMKAKRITEDITC